MRSWERRYHLFEPIRAANGYRLYSRDDIRRAAEMQAHLARGVAAAQAAELAKAADTPNGDREPVASTAASDVFSQLLAALVAYDGTKTERLLDRSLLTLGLAHATQAVVLPYLREVGACWQRGEIGVTEEHFATAIVRRRLLALAEEWDSGDGPVAVLTCAPGELHDIGLISFGLVLHNYYGWSVKFLGGDTPLTDLARALRRLQPAAVTVSAVTEAHFFRDLADWQNLASTTTLTIGGGGATPPLARLIGAEYLSGDPVAAAGRLATTVA